MSSAQGNGAVWIATLLMAGLVATTAMTQEVAEGPATEAIKAPRDELPLPEKVQGPDGIAPTVSIREEGGLVIEEYRVAGQITSVRVTSESGLSYEYVDIDGDGRLERNDKSDGVAPVFYTLYEWE